MPDKTRRVRNWEKFQHYQSGPHAKKKPDWIKLYTNLLDDIHWHKLPDRDAKILVELWMLASECGGTLPPLEEIAFRLRRPANELKSVLNRLPNWIEGTCLDSPAEVSRPEEKRIEEEVEEKENERERRARALPSQWHPSENHFLKARQRGFSAAEVEDMAEDMRIWAGANGKTKKDWDLAFHGWIRRQKRGQGPPKVSRTQEAIGNVLRRVSNGMAGGQSNGSGVCGQAISQLSAAGPGPGGLHGGSDRGLHGAQRAITGPDGEGDPG